MNWYTVREALWKHYTCQRCSNTVCTRVPAQITVEELYRLGEQLLATGRDKLIIEQDGILYLHPPCPFYGVCEDGEQGCKIHGERPEICKSFPFGEVPSILGLDFCPVAQQVDSDMQTMLHGMSLVDDTQYIESVKRFREAKEHQVEAFGEDVMKVKYYPLKNFILLLGHLNNI